MPSNVQTAALHYNFTLAQKNVREEPDKLVIEGLASNFDLVDRQGDRMNRRAFDRSLARYLRENPILLWNHRYDFPLGRVVHAFVSAAGLHIRAELPRPAEGTEALNVWRLVKAGVLKALSVGGYATRIGRDIVAWDLREISVASVGANASALFTLTEQVGKAMTDDVGRLEALRRESELLHKLNDALTLAGLHLELALMGR